MTIDEAINHCMEVADLDCNECGLEHRQLAEWLKELKALRGSTDARLKMALEQIKKEVHYYEEVKSYPIAGRPDEYGTVQVIDVNTLFDVMDEVSANEDIPLNELEEVKEERDALIGKLEAVEGELAEYKASNLGAMRNAMEIMLAWYEENHDDVNMMDDAMEKAKKALSAPARNCDRFSSADEAIGAYRQGHKHMVVNVFLDWLFAPAERKGEGDGR